MHSDMIISFESLQNLKHFFEKKKTQYCATVPCRKIYMQIPQ